MAFERSAVVVLRRIAALDRHRALRDRHRTVRDHRPELRMPDLVPNGIRADIDKRQHIRLPAAVFLAGHIAVLTEHIVNRVAVRRMDDIHGNVRRHPVVHLLDRLGLVEHELTDPLQHHIAVNARRIHLRTRIVAHAQLLQAVRLSIASHFGRQRIAVGDDLPPGDQPGPAKIVILVLRQRDLHPRREVVVRRLVFRRRPQDRDGIEGIVDAGLLRRAIRAVRTVRTNFRFFFQPVCKHRDSSVRAAEIFVSGTTRTAASTAGGTRTATSDGRALATSTAAAAVSTIDNGLAHIGASAVTFVKGHSRFKVRRLNRQISAQTATPALKILNHAFANVDLAAIGRTTTLSRRHLRLHAQNSFITTLHKRRPLLVGLAALTAGTATPAVGTDGGTAAARTAAAVAAGANRKIKHGVGGKVRGHAFALERTSFLVVRKLRPIPRPFGLAPHVCIPRHRQISRIAAPLRTASPATSTAACLHGAFAHDDQLRPRRHQNAGRAAAGAFA